MPRWRHRPAGGVDQTRTELSQHGSAQESPQGKHHPRSTLFHREPRAGRATRDTGSKRSSDYRVRESGEGLRLSRSVAASHSFNPISAREHGISEEGSRSLSFFISFFLLGFSPRREPSLSYGRGLRGLCAISTRAGRRERWTRGRAEGRVEGGRRGRGAGFRGPVAVEPLCDAGGEARDSWVCRLGTTTCPRGSCCEGSGGKLAVSAASPRSTAASPRNQDRQARPVLCIARSGCDAVYRVSQSGGAVSP